ncbi:hypothetical protein [Dehalococcoides sp.]|jgi:three-Cys-motif partner protein|uniref:hypothetical protein n=1 Tax=Dehalococcoides sp. TaxID=1966486 RepID=UPI0035659563
MSLPGQTGTSFKQPDKWDCYKFECLSDFLGEYAKSVRQPTGYLEAFAGSNQSVCAGINCPREACHILKGKESFFNQIILLAQSETALAALRKPLLPARADVLSGSLINEETLQKVLDSFPRSEAVFILLEPPGFHHLRFSSLKKLALRGIDKDGRKPDMLLVLPLEMSLIRNLGRLDCQDSISRFFGHDKWIDIRQDWYTKRINTEEARKRLLKLYLAGFKDMGYKHVVHKEPANAGSPARYQLAAVSDRLNFKNMLDTIWDKERFLSCELF